MKFKDKGPWILTIEEMPQSGVAVLACYKNKLGNWRIIRAYWVKAKTEESGIDSDIGEYNEATDTYYDPEGWYETNEYEDVHWAVSDVVTHWQPLPDVPNV